MLLKKRETCFGYRQLRDDLGKNSGRYHYKVFGLHIISDILLPELLVAIDIPDILKINIRLGKVPSHLIDPIDKTESYQAAKNQFLFQVPGVGCYYVTDGNSIIVEPAEQAEESLVRLFLLGTAFGVLLMQREILPIHGSAVVLDDCCVIFTGVSGAGKSTLLAAFRERGYSFLTDDVAAVTLDAAGIAWVHSAYPQQKLWQDSAKKLGVSTDNLTPFYTRSDRDKFIVPITQGFWSSPLPLVAIYEIGVERCKDVSLKPLAGIDKLAVLINHTYRSYLLGGLDLKGTHFKHCASIAKKISVSSLIRPEGVFSTEEQIRLIQQDFTRRLDERVV